ncbi:FadR/GntR family transcriptional regulator [Rhodanobacter sp. MP1X3]|uniref:FadR/GntR family transcriptional regulator n=1 Tax=Rhodanobacter sp. MP1X3 TaxID=2723086 RepID=UPI0016210812|nr:FadR/GntR family transcriptional regulator [Rhodanobacter sp. MP1X3]MBB6241459.1 DNA-binding FadR family transcriptional regulator [Rhodanobacter sp. MP1X3]
MAANEPQLNIHRQVVDQLGKMIVGGSLVPGDLLPSEEQLAEQLAVSRSALREAMKVLGAKGLIESRQKTGARVRERRFWHQLDAKVLEWRFATMPTKAFVAELIEMREIIEPAAAAAAAKKRDRDQLEAIGTAYQAMADASDRDAWAKADVEFHSAVLNAANNELMSSLFNVVATALHSFFQLSARASVDFKYSLPQHFNVYDAIRKRGATQARTAMQRLVDDSRRHLRQSGGAVA